MKCSMASTNLEIRNDGTFSPCCLSSYIFKNDDGVPYHISDSAIDDVWKSSDRIKFIEELNEYDIKECNICWEIEKSGGHSKRKLENDLRVDYDYFDIFSPMKSIDIKLGNVCNLKCVICSPYNSSYWYSDYQKLNGISFNNEKYKWAYKNDFVSHVHRHIKDLRMLELYGGEPMLLQSSTDILKYCVDNNYSKDIDVRMNTNGTILVTDEFLSILSNFKNVGFNWSIDSFEKNEFEYQRFPAKYDQVISNLLNVIQKRSHNISIAITYTVSVLNVFSIHSAIEFAKKYNLILHLNVLSYPDMLKFNNIKKENLDNYLKSLDDSEIKVAGIRANQLVNFSQNCNSEHNINMVREYLCELDKIRNTRYKTVIKYLDD